LWRLAEFFLDAFETLKDNQLKKSIHYLEDESSYYIRLAETLKIMKQQDYTFVQNPFIHDALKKHEQCKRSNSLKNSSEWDLKNKRQKIWEFSK